MPYSILIADAYPLMAEGEKNLFTSFSEITITGICLQYESLMRMLKSQEQPDAILLDPQLGKANGIELCKKIKLLAPASKILLFGTEDDPTVIKKYFQVGIKGYLLRHATSTDLLQALKVILNGEIFVDKTIEQFFFNLTLGLLKKKKTCSKLTKRECEVLHLIVEEYTTREIAQQLFIELCTVETHRQNLIQKLGVKNTAGLVRVALQNQLYQISW